MCILWALILDFGFTLKKQKEKNQKKKNKPGHEDYLGGVGDKEWS